MRVGFTGTRRGLTEAQRAALFGVLSRLRAQGAEVMDNGCCEGADREAHEIWRTLGGHFHFRPGDTAQQAWAAGVAGLLDMVEFPIAYLDRNRDIVNHASVVVAAPGEAVERLRSGTWATVRAARKAALDVLLVLPSGRVDTLTGRSQLQLSL